MQGCHDPAKREHVGEMFEERGLDVLIISEMKMKGRDSLNMENWVEELLALELEELENE